MRKDMHFIGLGRRAIPAFALTVGLALAIAACGGSSGGSSSATAGGGSTLTIGYTPGLTGELGPFDSEVLKGMRLRVQQLNAAGGAGGEQIKLEVRDGASDPAKQRAATQELLESGVNFMVGSCSAATSTPSAILAQSKSVPMVLTCAGESNFPASVGEFAFLANSGSLAEGAGMAQFAVETKKWKKAYVVGSEDLEYTKEIDEGFKGGFEKLGGEVVAEDQVGLFAQSYQSEVAKIAAYKGSYDFIETPLFVPDIVTFLKELRTAGVDAPVLIDDGGNSPLLFSAGDPGEIYVATFGFPRKGTNFGKFAAAYTKQYGTEPQSSNPGLGADIIDLIAAAEEKAGSNEPKALRDAFANLEDVEATEATISYAGAPYGQGLQEHPFTIVTGNAAHDGFTYAATVKVDPEIVPKP